MALTPRRREFLRRMARRLRNNMTPQELAMWEELKQGRFHKSRFSPQVLIGVHIVDFYSRPARLAVEIDSTWHGHKVHRITDGERDLHLADQKVKVLRFPNANVENDIDQVLNAIGLHLGIAPFHRSSTHSQLNKEEKSIAVEIAIPPPTTVPPTPRPDAAKPGTRPPCKHQAFSCAETAENFVRAIADVGIDGRVYTCPECGMIHVDETRVKRLS